MANVTLDAFLAGVTHLGTVHTGDDERKKNAETSTDSAPPPCKVDVQQQQHKASLQRVITSADMKVEGRQR